MLRRRLLFFVWSAVALNGVGCISLTSMQRANTLGKGKFEFSLEPGVVAAVDANSGAFGAAPRAEIAGHFGVGEQVDLGFRLGSVGLEFLSKFQLTRRDSPVVHVSLAPSINGIALFLGGGSGSSGGGGGLLGIQLPVLIGIDTGNQSELVIGPRVIDQLVFATGGGIANVVLVGGSLGYSIKITDHFRLHPEVAVAAPVLGTSPAGTTGGFVFGGVAVQGGLGFQFGN